MTDDQTQATLNANWCDQTLQCTAWQADGLALSLAFVAPNGTITTRRFDYVLGLDIRLENPQDSANPPMTLDAAFEQHDSGEWSVRIDFASQGYISFRCSTMSIE